MERIELLEKKINTLKKVQDDREKKINELKKEVDEMEKEQDDMKKKLKILKNL